MTIIHRNFKLQTKEAVKRTKDFNRLPMEEWHRYSAIYHAMMDAVDNGDVKRARFFAGCLAGYVAEQNAPSGVMERHHRRMDTEDR